MTTTTKLQTFGQINGRQIAVTIADTRTDDAAHRWVTVWSDDTRKRNGMASAHTFHFRGGIMGAVDRRDVARAPKFVQRALRGYLGDDEIK